MSYVVSIDPGDTCGVALWTDTGILCWKKAMSLEEFEVWCDIFDISLSVVVCENYVSRPGQRYEKKGSKMKASQGLGMAKLLARKHKAKFVSQQPDILRITALHAGIKVPQKGHIKDDVSAYLHGFRYFVSIGMLKPVLQQGS